jgi:hypothetical protein
MDTVASSYQRVETIVCKTALHPSFIASYTYLVSKKTITRPSSKRSKYGQPFFAARHFLNTPD